MDMQGSQPGMGQAPGNGPMSSAYPWLGGANLGSMQGPAVNVPAMYAGMFGGAGAPGMGNSGAPGQSNIRGGGPPQLGVMPGAGQRQMMPGQGQPPPSMGGMSGMGRPGMGPIQGGAPPQFGAMPGQGQPPPSMGGMSGGAPGGSMGTPQLGLLEMLMRGNPGAGGPAGPMRARTPAPGSTGPVRRTM